MPQTLFELLGLPPERASEVQFRSLPTFYANLFAKVFCYLEKNNPGQEWLAVAVFRGRNVEPIQTGPYEDLLQSRRLRRVYLDELPMSADPPLGLGILQLVSAPVSQAQDSRCPVVTQSQG